MRAALNEEDVTEVGIYCHKDAIVSLGMLEERPVAGIRSELARLDDVVPRIAQPLGKATPSTSIDQKLQRPNARTMSI